MSNPFKSISENLPFWPDRDNQSPEPFTGVLVEESLILGEDKDPTKNVPVFVFAAIDTGEKFFITKSYAIEKAVKVVKAKGLSFDDTVFHFVFKGKTEAKGKPFNQFDTAYCSILEYNMSKETPTEDTASKKKK